MTSQVEYSREDSGRLALFNQSIEKAFAILELFSAQNNQLSLSEITKLSGMSMGSVQRLIYTLQELKYVERVPGTKRYRVGIKIMTLASRYMEADLLVDCANPFLSELGSRCSETVALTEPCGSQMIYLARFTSRQHLTVYMPIGSSVPMYCTASGRAFLSAWTDERVREYLCSVELIKYTPQTVTDIDELLDTIRACRARGVAWNNSEYLVDDLNIAAPILNAAGTPVAAIHINTPASRWTLEKALEELAPPLIECARAISQSARAKIGYV